MKTVPFMIGIGLGMVMAGSAVSAMYPDVARRAARDARKAVKTGKRMACNLLK